MKKVVKSIGYLLAISLIVFLLPVNTTKAAVAPTYVYEWISQSGTISADGLAHEFVNLQAGQTIKLTLTLRNQSGNTICSRQRLGNPEAGKQVPVGSYGIGSQTPNQDGTPSFLDLSSFILNNNRFTYYEGEDVAPGGTMTISWDIKLKDNLANGVYNLYVRPVSEYLAWTRQIKNGQLLPTTSSDIFWRLVVGQINPGYITYANSEYGFSLSHPGDWNIEEPGYNAYGWAALFGMIRASGAQDYSSTVAISDNSLNQEVQLLRDNTYEYSLPNDHGGRGYGYSISEQSTTLNGIPTLAVIIVKTYTHPDPELFPGYQEINHNYFLELGGHVFVLQGGIWVEDGRVVNLDDSIGLDIIKTFRRL
ncbi:MAG: hypothetical protein V1807_00045 [Patescibacteria group bacterium]